MAAPPTIGIAGRVVPRVGFGAMLLSTSGRPEHDEALRVLHATLDAGTRLVDTADAYCLSDSETGHNEKLVAEAMRSWPGPADEVLVATKGGHVRTAEGGWQVDGRPEHLREACDASLRRLGLDAIGLYQFHRPDPTVPFEESIGAMAELVAAGKVRAVGLSNVDSDQIDVARGIVPIASVQNRFGPDFRSSLGELRQCGSLGIPFLAWSPLGGGRSASRLGKDHPAFAAVGAARGVSAQQVALAWELAQGDHVVPIPGARRVETALDSAAALDLELTDDELTRLDAEP